MCLLAVATSEAIAEAQGSHIDSLHECHCNTDKDDIRLQKELQLKLMGPDPCIVEGEKFVNKLLKG